MSGKVNDPRVVETKLPMKTILSAVAIGVLLLAFIVYAVWASGVGIMDAKKTGTITKKEFVPAPEEQIILQRQGGITANHKDGEYILTVDVPLSNGTTKSYNVWMPDKKSYDAVKVGDKYDVGPVLVHE